MKRSISAVVAAVLLNGGWAILALGGPLEDSGIKSGVDSNFVDSNVRPQDDLFRHVNGKWLAGAPIPPDRPLDGAFYKLRDLSEANLRKIIEETAAKPDSPAGSEAQKVGDLFASFMDETTVNDLGLKPIQADLDAVTAIQDKPGLIRTLAKLQNSGIDGTFGLFVNTDAKQSDRYIIYLSQGGIGLPDESYYRLDQFKSQRDAYLIHIRKMFELADYPDPEKSAERVLALETRLAKDHWDRVKNRDDELTYNKKNLKALSELTPGFDWQGWLEAAGINSVEEVIVGQPSYFSAMSRAIEQAPLEDWKAWLTWNVLRNYAPLLSKPFVDENFDFYGKTLTGSQELKPRWKRGVGVVEGSLGEVVGKLYVEKHFPPAAKDRMQQLVANLIEAYRQDIQSLEWMGDETKKKALEKLAKFNPKIGYPDKWRDYSRLEIRRDDLIGNAKRATEFEFDRQLAKLGKPVDRSEWFMTPQTVNAYYNPGMNEIVFPAAILQPPFFDLEADDAVNYGGIGAVIGHEIGHGFDDQGSKYDGEGNLKDWWTDEDRKEFEGRAKKLIEQYDGFEPTEAPGQHVNGALTIGENIGDLGGLTIAYKAYKLALANGEAPILDKLTGDQRFFIGWAQVWRAKYRPAELTRRIAVDPHSPAEFRCNGVIRNIPEFYRAFGVKEGDKLWLSPDRRVQIW
ncbi:M13 family metallopeptidase [Tundrisphaera lichenicola]|uniref:M13 family metallopeptidase n=1 Tax=Tundrisphaera lichenicola TaxID=2029860 RepID=UPI003EB976ED